ncbi:SLATT domain-containing protein [Streptomyces sp. NPDC087300]|uniref:SLATT domain-containing protein n=1 Tax=Streptomyces sp. NPDC087300 TaxID=3365780 RepID=UPI00380C977A
MADVIAQLQQESQKYRNWQKVSVICLAFGVTLATAFNGYYKHRGRSYFLRQTADAIAEEVNAFILGIGEYREFTQEQEDQALAKFTHRVETLRNEQRKREQQLDQPADQAVPLIPPSA